MERYIRPPKANVPRVFVLKCKCDPDTVTLNDQHNSENVILDVNSNVIDVKIEYDSNYIDVHKIDDKTYVISKLTDVDKETETKVYFTVTDLIYRCKCNTVCNVVIEPKQVTVLYSTTRALESDLDIDNTSNEWGELNVW